MARRLFVFEDPDRFLAAAIGEPGSRAFFLQVREGSAVISVGIEKTQVAALASHISELLDTLDSDVPIRNPAGAGDEPEAAAGVLFRVGAITLAWDPDHARLIIEAQPLGAEGPYREVDDDDPDGPDLLRVRVSSPVAREFAVRAAELVAGGRPACPFCGMPLESIGHFCPRSNGHLN